VNSGQRGHVVGVQLQVDYHWSIPLLQICQSRSQLTECGDGISLAAESIRDIREVRPFKDR
jgi:hypothetical protein